MRIASRQGKSLQEAKAANSAQEVPKWRAFFLWEANSFAPWKHYLAQIAAEVRNTRYKNPNQYKVEDLLLKFERVKTTPKEDLEDEELRAKAAKRSKAAWGAILGRRGAKKKQPAVKRVPKKKKRK